MPNERVANVILSYRVDNSVNQAVEANRKVAASLQEVEAAGRRSGAVSFSSMAEASQALGLNLQTSTNELQKQTYLADRLTQAAKAREASEAGFVAQLRQEALTGGGAGNAVNTQAIQRGLFNARQAAIALPGIGYQSPIAVILRFTELLAGLGPVGLAAIGVLGAVGGAFALLSQEANKASKEIVASAGAYREAREAALINSRQELEDRRDYLQQLAEVQRQSVQETNARAVNLIKQGGALPLVGEIVAPGVAGAREAADAANAALLATETELNSLNIVLAGTDETVGGLTQQFEELQDRLAKNQELLSDRQTSRQLQGAQNEIDAQRMTREERDKTIASLSEEITGLEHYRDRERSAGRLTEAAALDLANRIDDARDRMKAMTDVTYSFADAAAQYEQRITDQLSVIQESIAYQQQLSEQIRTSTPQQVEDRLYALQQEAAALKTFIPELEKLAPTSQEAAKQLADARSRLSEISSDYADQLIRVLPSALARARTSLQAEITQIETESGQRINQILADQVDKEAKALDDRNDAYLAAEDKRGEALNDLAEKQGEARAKIERNANATIVNAVRSRNALAAQLAIEQKKQDLKDLEDQGKSREKEIDKQLRKEKEVADVRYRDQLDAAKAAADKSVSLERQKAQAEINQKVASYNAQISALSVFTQSGTQLVYDFVNHSLQALTALANHQVQTPALPPVIEYPGLPPGVTLPPVTGYQPYPDQIGRPYALGGYARPGLIRVNENGLESALNRRGQLLLLKEPMKIFSAPMTQRLLSGQSGGSGAGLTINVPIQGSQLRKRDIQDMVYDELDDALTKAGWD